MSVRLVALEVDAQDPGRLAEFWAAILGRVVAANGTTLPGLTDTDFALRFVAADAPKDGLHRMHPDLTSASAADQKATVAIALSLGGRHLDVGQRGDEGHVVLADPEGNEFCILRQAGD